MLWYFSYKWGNRFLGNSLRLSDQGIYRSWKAYTTKLVSSNGDTTVYDSGLCCIVPLGFPLFKNTHTLAYMIMKPLLQLIWYIWY